MDMQRRNTIDLKGTMPRKSLAFYQMGCRFRPNLTFRPRAVQGKSTDGHSIILFYTIGQKKRHPEHKCVVVSFPSAPNGGHTKDMVPPELVKQKGVSTLYALK